MRDMLRNPIYKGDLTWGKRRQGIFARDENLWNDNQQSWHHDPDKWVSFHDESLRIVSDELWERVQVVRPIEYARRDYPQKFPLVGGLVYCEQCGGRYYYREEKRSNRVLKRYQDFNRNRIVNCKRNVLRADVLHDYADQLILQSISEEIMEQAFARAREIIKAESGIDDSIKAGVRPEIERLEKQE